MQQLGLGPLIAAWADNQLRDPSAAEDVGPQCARLLAALVTGAAGNHAPNKHPTHAHVFDSSIAKFVSRDMHSYFSHVCGRYFDSQVSACLL